MKTADVTSARKPRYIVVGGFLGAGKSTALARLAPLLLSRGHKVGFITNDEGTELVDTAQFRSAGFPVEEVQGGAFPAQLESFLASAHRHTSLHCDAILAECSGTSAELRSHLLTPLRQKLGDSISIAPLSVFVDPIRAARILRLESGGSFSEKLAYLYRKQLEEAELLVINKADLLTPTQATRLRKALSEIATNAALLNISARTGAGFDEWAAALLSREHIPTAPPPLDPQLYSEAQSALGWLNCTVNVSSVRYFDANKLLNDLATAIQSLLKQDALEVAHLKLMLRAKIESTGETGTAAVNLVRNDLAPELSGKIPEPVERAELILNVRAESKPDLLHSAVNRAVLEIMERAPELFARMEHCEHFRPSNSRRNELATRT